MIFNRRRGSTIIGCRCIPIRCTYAALWYACANCEELTPSFKLHWTPRPGLKTNRKIRLGIQAVFNMRCARHHFTHGGSGRGGLFLTVCIAVTRAASRVVSAVLPVFERKRANLRNILPCKLNEATLVLSFELSCFIGEKGNEIIGQSKPIARESNLGGNCLRCAAQGVRGLVV